MTKPHFLHRLCPLKRAAQNKPLAVAYVVMFLAIAAGFFALQHYQARELRARCEQSVQGRQVLRDLVVLSTEQAPLDLTALPSYRQLDPASKAYFRELGQLLQAGSGPNNQFRQRALEQLPVPTC